MFNDYTGSLTHFNGLEVVIRQRGGVQSFVSNPVLRTVFFWYFQTPLRISAILFH